MGAGQDARAHHVRQRADDCDVPGVAEFLTQETFFSQSRFIALYVLVAMSQAVCLVVGDMNLTVGAVGSFTTVLLGLAISKEHAALSSWVAVPLVFLIGPITGFLHGTLITRLKVDAFIVTLSMMFVYMGLRSGISKGSSYTIPESFWWLGQGSIAGVIPFMLLIVLVVMWLTAHHYKNTVLGRRLLATGSNADAARLSGINTRRMILIAHVFSGCFAAAAAIIWASWSGNAAPQTGDDWLIISFAVAIIGGTGLKGSLISPMGIFMGAIIFKLIQHSLVILKINDNFSNTVLGALILLAIIVDRARERLAEGKNG